MAAFLLRCLSEAGYFLEINGMFFIVPFDTLRPMYHQLCVHTLHLLMLAKYNEGILYIQFFSLFRMRNPEIPPRFC